MNSENTKSQLAAVTKSLKLWNLSKTYKVSVLRKLNLHQDLFSKPGKSEEIRFSAQNVKFRSFQFEFNSTSIKKIHLNCSTVVLWRIKTYYCWKRNKIYLSLLLLLVEKTTGSILPIRYKRLQLRPFFTGVYSSEALAILLLFSFGYACFQQLRPSSTRGSR